MLNHNLSRSDRGFSLVELSIVLVILGLLTGGILAGQSLIRAAELRRTMNFIQETNTGWNTFKDKYFQIPGDFTRATEFWGRSSNATFHGLGCVTQPGTPTADGTCNGDGDNYVNYYTVERQLAWDHMKRAGVVGFPTTDQSGYQTLIQGQSSGSYALIANNDSAPSLKVFMSISGNVAPDGVPAKGIGIRFSRNTPTGGSLVGVLSPEELWRMDTKMDDGMPQSGRAFAFNGRDPSGAAYYTTCLNLVGSSYEYNVAETGKVCQALYALELR